MCSARPTLHNPLLVHTFVCVAVCALDEPDRGRQLPQLLREALRAFSSTPQDEARTFPLLLTPSLPPRISMATVALKAQLTELQSKRSAIEADVQQRSERLNQPGMPGLKGSLLDKEVCPFAWRAMHSSPAAAPRQHAIDSAMPGPAAALPPPALHYNLGLPPGLRPRWTGRVSHERTLMWRPCAQTATPSSACPTTSSA